MLFYKLAGTALLLFCGGMTGRAICEKSKTVLTRTEGFIALIKYIRNQIDCYLMPLEKILAGCPDDILEACGSIRGAKTIFEFLGSCDLQLSDESVNLLNKFAAELGSGYRDTQLKLCDYYIGKLTSERDRMQSEYPARRKMIMTLCLCAAAGAAVIML
jgi:hypothetical protein